MCDLETDDDYMWHCTWTLSSIQYVCISLGVFLYISVIAVVDQLLFSLTVSTVSSLLSASCETH